MPRCAGFKAPTKVFATKHITTVRKRKITVIADLKNRMAGAGIYGVWKFYTDESPSGIKIGPVQVIVMSLVFIASVLMLHILAKYNRENPSLPLH